MFTANDRAREVLRFEILRHRALAKLMENPLLRADHLDAADILEEVLEEHNEKEAICKIADGQRLQSE